MGVGVDRRPRVWGEHWPIHPRTSMDEGLVLVRSTHEKKDLTPVHAEIEFSPGLQLADVDVVCAEITCWGKPRGR